MTLSKQKSIKQIRMLWYLVLTIASINNVEYTVAQVTPDGTTNTMVDTNGDNFNINQGDRSGNNLFHSFSDFSLPDGGTASFNNNTDIVNIFSRVTGGNISDINGLINANGNANLFIINPAGIIFGKNASLNLGGSFYASTADSILFPDNLEFSASDPQAQPLLTINAPIGLNLGNNSGDIVNRSLSNNLGLEVADGKNLALIGGNINLGGGLITAPGGKVELGGLLAAGEIKINSNGSFSFPEAVTRGDIFLTNNSKVNVRAGGGGFINLNAHNVTLSQQSELLAGIAENMGFSNAQAGDITIDATDSVRLLGQPRQTALDAELRIAERDTALGIRNNVGTSFVNREDNTNPSSAIGNGGKIQINSKNLELTNIALLDTSIFGSGNGGDIIINSDSVVLNQGVILSQVRGFNFVSGREQGNGDAGNVLINTSSLLLTDDAKIFADVQIGAMGNGGDVVIQAADQFIQNENSFILTQLGMDNIGSAGNIEITAGSYEIGARTTLPALQSDSSTGSTGDAGNINITVENDFSIANNLILSQVQREGNGNAGDINITASDIVVDDLALISSNIRLEAMGAAGDINLSANHISISNGAVVDALTESNSDGGSININTETINLSDGGKIVTSGDGGGNAGSINLTVAGTLALGNDNLPEESPFTESILQDIALETGLFSSTVGDSTGGGGSINIQAGSIQLDNGSISATTSSGTGGNVTLNIDNLLTLGNSSLISAQADSSGDGGNININSDFVIAFADGNSDIIANAFSGNGGQIEIDTQALFGIESREQLTSGNDISASSEFGLDGLVEIDTLEIDPTPRLTELSTAFAVPQLLRGCQASQEADSSSFINTGRGGLPPNPFESLDNSNVFNDVELPSKWTESSEVDSASLQKEAIVEANAWVMNQKGNVELVANELPTTIFKCGDS